MNSRDDQVQMIEDCENRESRLSPREGEFIDSIKKQMEKGRTLSPAQDSWLDDIWERVTKDG